MRITSELKLRIASLQKLSLQGLVNLYDEEKGLFTYFVRRRKRIPMPLSWSICYTAITLLGLNKANCIYWQEFKKISKKKTLQSLINNWQ